MAANTVAAGMKGAPLHVGEKILTPGYHTELELRVPATMEGPKRTERALGAIWLTDERIVWVANSPASLDTDDGLFGSRTGPPAISSLIIPYYTVRKTDFKLPVFASNHLNIHFNRDPTHRCPHLPDTGLEQDLVAKLTIGNGLGHRLWKRIEKERAAWNQRAQDAEVLPEYSAAAAPAYTPTPPGSPPPEDATFSRTASISPSAGGQAAGSPAEQTTQTPAH